jgi:8-oxo-dGTP pyrophosphatase MutT (NUDIX family)
MRSLDWTRLDSRYVVRDEWLALRADTYRLPDDHLISPLYILEYRTWVNVVALTSAGEVVLVRQYRPGIGRTTLEFPGGTTDPEDVSPLEGIRRELLEETGYTADEFVETGRICPNPASHNNIACCFLATDARQVSDSRPDATEHIEVVLIPLEDVIALAKAGGLPQALHVSSLFFALAKLGRVA